MCPEALNAAVREPLSEDDAAGTPRTGVRLDPALTVRDTEVAGLAPARAPAVLADPEAAGVAVADDRDAVASGQIAGHVPIDPAPVREEVLVHEEARRDGAVRRDPLLHRRRGGQVLHRGDLRVAVRPVGVDVAVLVAGGVREVILERDTLVTNVDERALRPPTVAAVAAFRFRP